MAAEATFTSRLGNHLSVASIFSTARAELAIDFGTANLRVISRAGGVVFDEPSLCCFTRRGGASRLYAAGREAQEMVDRTPPELQIKRPLIRGVLQDIEAASDLLRYAVSRVGALGRLKRPKTVIGLPADATQAERSALLTTAQDAGLGAVTLVAEPLAAAWGADLPVDAPNGAMIVECGAGTTEAAILSLGGICLSRSIRLGGAALDEAFADYLHGTHRFLIGERTAERLKRNYLDSRSSGASAPIRIRGRSLRTGLPAAIEIAPSELDSVAERHAAQIVGMVREALAATPPELSFDIYDRGIVLTGGSATPLMIGQMISEATGIPTSIAVRPDQCVARGLHHLLAR